MTRRKRPRTSPAIVAASLAAAALVMLAAAPSSSSGADGHEHAGDHAAHGTIVRVVGSGEVSLSPDRAEVSIGATHQAPNAKDAQEKVNLDVGEMVRAVKGLRLKGEMIQTSGVSLSPIYERSRNSEPKIVGYRASNTLRVRFDDVDRVGEVLDIAIEHGANQASGVRFMLQDRASAELDALSAAVNAARVRATIIASTLGVQVEAIETIEEQGAGAPPVVQRGGEMARAMSFDAAAAPTPVEAGKITVRAGVTMQARLGSD